MPKTLFVLILCLLLFIGGCAAPKLFSHVVHEDPTSFVRLEFSPSARVDRPSTLHTHPAFLTEEQLKQIFSGLMVKEHRSTILLWVMDEAELQPAFTEKEIQFLIQHVGNALQQAVSEEVVTFYMSTPLNSVTREVTSGLLYIQGQEFHLRLSNYRTAYTIPPFGVVYDRRHPAYSLTPRDFDLVFHPADYVIPNRIGFWEGLVGETHEGEVILDLSRISALRL